MTEKNDTEVMIDYCFNEFLKMCDFLKGELDADNRKFLHFILYVFNKKVDERKNSELVAMDHFPLPQEKDERSWRDNSVRSRNM